MSTRRLNLIAMWLAAVTLLPAAGGWAAPDAAPLPNGIIATRQTAFSIPFSVGQPQSAAEQPVEVQLHVSVDQGVTWNVSTRVKPDAKLFAFRAAHDGEYWFAIRTVDRQGKPHPDGPQRPELKVLIDTVPPRLDLKAVRGASGEIIARWQAVDPDLKPDSLKIEYQTGPNAPWESLAIESPAADSARHTLSGSSTWWPKSSGAVTLRASVSDHAGNPTVTQIQLKHGETMAADKATQAAAARQAAVDLSPRGRHDLGADAGGGLKWPADRSSADPLSRDRSALAANDRDRQNGRDDDWRHASGDGQSGIGPLGSPADGLTGQRPAAQPVGRERRAAEPGQTWDLSVLPPGERPRMVNSRTFELEYEVDSVGPSGIAKVELWCTRDGGRTWSSFGVDPDNRSPLEVKVDGDGIYGFRVVVQNGSGLGGLAPRAGDLPEIWIGVDCSRPSARITAAEIGRDGGELAIRWEASDDMPDARPISLGFSDRPGGPWSAIVSGLENTGSYAWRIDNRVPDQIYLRLEVRDEAGNVGVYETPEPVSLNRQRPQGRIRNVRPVN